MELKNPIKKRDAVYCNLKLFLIFLVIYGHMIEERIYEDAVLMQVYRMIYSFHMPLFLFLSGLFLTDSAGCFRQMKKMLFLYCILQLSVVFVGNLSGGHFSLWIPVWHLWYLLSLAWMDLRVCYGIGSLGGYEILNRERTKQYEDCFREVYGDVRKMTAEEFAARERTEFLDYIKSHGGEDGSWITDYHYKNALFYPNSGEWEIYYAVKEPAEGIGYDVEIPWTFGLRFSKEGKI